MTRDWTAEYEVLAEEFYRKTGILAPGSSVPLEMASTQPADGVRWQQWLEFLERRRKADEAREPTREA